MPFAGEASEHKFAAKLDNPAGMRGLHLTETWIVWIVSDRSSDSSRGEWIKAVLMMVEYVKGFRPELKRYPFGESEVLSQSDGPSY